eukprot:EG_transcript_13565
MPWAPCWALVLVVPLCLVGGVPKPRRLPEDTEAFEPVLYPMWECNHTACRPGAALAPLPAERRPGAPQRLAVITAGLVGRYVVNGTWPHFAAPAVRAGHTVDYYVSLSPHKYKSWLQKTYLPDPDLGDALDDPSFAAVCAVIRARWAQAGATVRHCDVRTAPELTAAERDWVAHSNMFRWGAGRLTAREGALRHWKVWTALWRKAQEVERTLSHPYTQVWYVKDDTYWFADFDLDAMLAIARSTDPSALGRRSFSLDCNEAHHKLRHLYVNENTMAFERGSQFLTADVPEFLLRNPLGGNCMERHLRRLVAQPPSDLHFRLAQPYLPFQRVARMPGKGYCIHSRCMRPDSLDSPTLRTQFQYC